MSQATARRLFGTALAGATWLVLGAVTIPVAAHADGASAAAYLSRLNGERSSHGLAPLQVTGDLTAVAQNWSASMASSQQLAHNPSLTSQVSNWEVVGENVGEGPTIDALDHAFWNSAEHRANILDSGYSQVGVGTVERDGIIWITVDFRQPSAGSSAPSTATHSGGTTSGGSVAPSAPATVAPTTTPNFLRRGVISNRVAWAQRRLGIRDDGVFGPHTYQAVVRFQRKHHLLVDGVVGPETRAAMHRVARAARAAARKERRASPPVPPPTVMRGLSADGSI